MKNLQSVKNPVVQAARALDSARERKRQNAFLLDGEHMVGEALRACPQRVQTLFVEEGRDYAALRALAHNDVYTVPGHVLAAISQVKTSQGIAAVCTLPDSTPLEKMGNRLVLLENVQDPGNVGTVLRTLDAAGFDGCVLTPGCADPFGPKALRATMGSVFRVPICQADSACQAVEQLNRQFAEGSESAIGQQKGGIALRNVNSRIRLMFGEDYGLHIFSAVGIGTECCVTLPLLFQGE